MEQTNKIDESKEDKKLKEENSKLKREIRQLKEEVSSLKNFILGRG